MCFTMWSYDSTTFTTFARYSRKCSASLIYNLSGFCVVRSIAEGRKRRRVVTSPTLEWDIRSIQLRPLNFARRLLNHINSVVYRVCSSRNTGFQDLKQWLTAI